MNAAGAVILVFNPDLVLYAEIWEKGREKRKGLILDMQRKYLYHCLKQLMEHKLVSSRARATVISIMLMWQMLLEDF